MKNFTLVLLMTFVGSTIYAQQIANELLAPFTISDSTDMMVVPIKRIDSDYDGVIDRIEYFEFNANGFQTKRSVDENDDGDINRVDVTFRNINNDITLETYDYDGDGIVDETLEKMYDASFNLVREEADFDNDGVLNSIKTYTYDANNNLSSRISDHNADGVADDIEIHQYDMNGTLVEINNDDDADGLIDNNYYFTFDAQGNMTSWGYDFDGNTTIDNLQSWVYNGNNQVTTHNFVIDNVIHYTYINNLLDKVEMDAGADGVLDEIVYYAYDGNGNQTSIISDSDYDGFPESIELFTYSSNNHLLTHSEDLDANGVADKYTVWTKDSEGNVISFEKDETGDGDFDYAYYNDHDFLKNCLTVAGLANRLYQIEIPYAGDWIFSTCGNITNFDTKIFVGSTACNQDLGDNDDYCGNTSSLELSLSGPQTVYLIVNGENNKVGNFELSVFDKNATGIREIAQLDLEVYPNPASSTLKIKDGDLDGMTYVIFNALGTKRLEGELDFSAGIDLNNLSTGMYFLKVEGVNTVFNASFLKK